VLAAYEFASVPFDKVNGQVNFFGGGAAVDKSNGSRVGGDTKVVERGKADGMYMSTIRIPP
jgi:hypothetical protein